MTRVTSRLLLLLCLCFAVTTTAIARVDVLDTRWVVENEGVAPDIEVEQTPADVISGRDPQLEKAIEVVLQALKKNPPADPQRPAFPIKGKTQRGTVPTGRGGGGGQR